jgi:primosomal protein N' (replication factor Y)
VFVDVAVAVPVADPLTYAVPEELGPFAAPGVRVRVEVGRRRVGGVILARRSAPPPGVVVRPLLAVVDAEPVVSASLLALARFVSDYYLAPPGEVLRAMVPSTLPPVGNRRYALTDRGALAPARGPLEERLVELLRERGRATTTELVCALLASRHEPEQGSIERPAAPAAEEPAAELRREVSVLLERWVVERRLAASDEHGETARGHRYLAAVELAPGGREELLAAAGRSSSAREVVAHLAELRRPCTVSELEAATGASAAVVRRLVRLGVLRRFTQIAPLSLERHRLGAGPAVRPEILLRPDQREAVEAIMGALAAGRYAPFLLQGVTGAGKTEVYLRAVERCLEAGRSALLLVPEIALVPALAREVESRFPQQCAILHSSLGAGERAQEWDRVRTGGVRVVVGPRSAVFAPLDDLGLIVVDEEQDAAFKQEVTPRYHGRDLALVRGREAQAVVVLASATPSLETLHNVARGKLEVLRLTARAGQGRLPEGVLVDLRQETGDPGAPAGRQSSFSARLREELAAVLGRGDQAILFRNRRGYAPILLCRACGEDFRCEDCGLPRTWHRREGRLLCHYCGAGRAVPDACPTCGERALEPVGTGTERVEEEMAELFPGIEVAVLDRDAVRRVGGAAGVLERFGRGEAQVLVGTQMVAKGHHFPRVALAAVLSADSFLSFPDFRAVERTYSLLTQLAGRAGRGELPGKVVVQTLHPDHYAIRAALANDDATFVAEEMRFRRIYHYPPFTRMVQLLWSDRNRARGESAMRELGERLERAGRGAEGLRISGPAPAPLERLRGEWRFQLLLRAAGSAVLRRLLRTALPDGPPRELVVDVDPQSLL